MSSTTAPATQPWVAAGQPPVLQARHISKRFGGVQALDDVSLDLLPGEVHCLARRERLWQVHADQDDLRRRASRLRRDRGGRCRPHPDEHHLGHPERDPGDLPGLLPVREPDGGREHRAHLRGGRQAEALPGRRGSREGAGHRRGVAARSGSGRRRREPVGGRSAAHRDLPGSGQRRPGDHHGRADHGPDPLRGGASLRRRRAAAGPRCGPGFRLPQAARGAGHLPAAHHHAFGTTWSSPARPPTSTGARSPGT